MNAPLITLTTDFGLCDSYVAQMKGVILGIAPQAILVDVTHEIPPQDCHAASAILAEMVGAFPSGTIHLVVVDPGVGTDRRAVAVETLTAEGAVGPRFVAPDNGVLTAVLAGRGVNRAVRLTERRYWRPIVSNTFHGRDIFAPAAAHWSLGIDLDQLGQPLDSPLIALPVDLPSREGDAVCGRVVRSDSFGNLITNIPGALIPDGEREGLVVEIGKQQIRGISRTYGEKSPGELLALVGSSGALEIAVCGGHAGEILAAWSGDSVIVRGLRFP